LTVQNRRTVRTLEQTGSIKHTYRTYIWYRLAV